MIMIIAMTYIFLCYVIFDQQLLITFRKSSAAPPPPLKKNFSGPHAERGEGEDTVRKITN